MCELEASSNTASCQLAKESLTAPQTFCRDKEILLQDLQHQKTVAKLKQQQGSSNVSPEPSNISEQVSSRDVQVVCVRVCVCAHCLALKLHVDGDKVIDHYSTAV